MKIIIEEFKKMKVPICKECGNKVGQLVINGLIELRFVHPNCLIIKQKEEEHYEKYSEMRKKVVEEGIEPYHSCKICDKVRYYRLYGEPI